MNGVYGYSKLQLPAYLCRLIYTVVATKFLPSSFTHLPRDGRGAHALGLIGNLECLQNETLLGTVKKYQD